MKNPMKTFSFVAAILLAACMTHAGADDFTDFFHQDKKPIPGPKIFRLTGRIFQKMDQGQYLVSVEPECAQANGFGKSHTVTSFPGEVPGVTGVPAQTTEVRDWVTVLLCGEPQVRSGDDIECWVTGDGKYSYTTTTGRQATIPAFRPSAAPTPTPSKYQGFFGPNTKMQGSALGQ